ncbi:hypothetical protein ESOMN_v1c06680 [Williamsoniiplasma somnilux]|uniref:ABC transporter ATP-binding protein n=1 Tax=Williamsoniiplasma somnilux TaxID=215578 RepID=A0A2K8NYZ2_9MOLU|nr:hypothetical protein [Williamsoniiplasma somnilux]ATZ19050.1 hypothetical protein ESOMN_v1c06680 [Williamsoniiplasma somnilux]
MITHDEEEMAKFCSRVIYFQKGKIIDDFKLDGDYTKRKQIIKNKIKNFDFKKGDTYE